MSLVERIHLIDSYESDQTEIMGRWYVAKPLTNHTFLTRLMHAIWVFRGRATAVVFAVDRINQERT